MSNQNASIDDNQYPALTAHAGTADGSETRKVVATSAGSLNISNTSDYFVELTRGNIPGQNSFPIAGHSSAIGNTLQTVWEHETSLVYLTEDTQLYASSTDIGDDFIGLAYGLDSDYNIVTRLFTANGQNQVALSGLMYRVIAVFIVGGSINVGDIYIAESDNLTNGKPDTNTKVQGKMLAGTGQGVNAYMGIPAGKSSYVSDLIGSVAKAKDAQIYLEFTVGGLTNYSPPFEVFQAQFNFPSGFMLSEKSDIQIMARSNDADSRVTVGLNLILIDN